VLRGLRLPATSVTVDAHGVVGGYPGRARFERIVVSPAVVDGDGARVHDYEQAAVAAHDRCFIGHTLAADVDYRLGWVAVAPAEATAA
jgi:hypothetical protein